MTLSGNVHEGDWVVSVETSVMPDGRYASAIHLTHSSSEGSFDRSFQHSRTFITEREAVLEGLREGMTWIELKRSGTLRV